MANKNVEVESQGGGVQVEYRQVGDSIHYVSYFCALRYVMPDQRPQVDIRYKIRDPRFGLFRVSLLESIHQE